jgi:hypothetical protein
MRQFQGFRSGVLIQHSRPLQQVWHRGAGHANAEIEEDAEHVGRRSRHSPFGKHLLLIFQPDRAALAG